MEYGVEKEKDIVFSCPRLKLQKVLAVFNRHNCFFGDMRARPPRRSALRRHFFDGMEHGESSSVGAVGVGVDFRANFKVCIFSSC